jgi:hypothetical protein
MLFRRQVLSQSCDDEENAGGRSGVIDSSRSVGDIDTGCRSGFGVDVVVTGSDCGGDGHVSQHIVRPNGEALQ